jgi:hypothetical protein
MSNSMNRNAVQAESTAQTENMVQAEQTEKKPASIVRSVGGRTYTVLIHFNEDARESVGSKMERVILSDLAGMAV